MIDLEKLNAAWVSLKRKTKSVLIKLESLIAKRSLHKSSKFCEWKKLEKCKVLFHRDYRGYTGGHLKVYDYYRHLIDIGCDVDIFFTSRSVWDNIANVNPWKEETENIVSEYNPKNYDILFIEGMDWAYLEPGVEEIVPVINLVQGFRQTNKENTQLYNFLFRKATRIGVSNEVAESMRLTNDANGPIHTIPCGINLHEISVNKTNDIYIMGKKNTKMALELYEYFTGLGYRTICSTKNILRDENLDHMAKSSISVLLSSPGINEGFFLPALESMTYSDITIVPDCIGNRSFCFDGKNCLMPKKYTKDHIIKKVELAFSILKDYKLLNKYKSAALLTVNRYSIEAERVAFYKILNEVFINQGKV
ncbi:hypothetical protein RGQ13_14315 [Thalassotalea psychrophila]|uniref:Glycosyl transferase family 1 domain-containing protein n=1 Tax=Thalassotalea psychrophila TaxID=3065647 RepID=A0ABY9TRD3_9GAMM|nr:hypothetical protein RGQ13_14315 [Colwelliaceae bacterium SQ149]